MLNLKIMCTLNLSADPLNLSNHWNFVNNSLKIHYIFWHTWITYLQLTIVFKVTQSLLIIYTRSLLRNKRFLLKFCFCKNKNKKFEPIFFYLLGMDSSSAKVILMAWIWTFSKRSTLHQASLSFFLVWKQRWPSMKKNYVCSKKGIWFYVKSFVLILLLLWGEKS